MTERLDGKRLLRSSSVYALGQMGGSFIGFLLLPVFTRYLAPSEYGLLETAATIGTILIMVFLFGMENALFRFSFDSDSRERRQEITSTVSIFLAVVSGAGVLLLVLFSGRFSVALFDCPDKSALLRLTFLFVFVSILMKIPLSVFRIHDRPVPYSISTMAHALIIIALNVYFVVALGKGAEGVMAGRLYGTAAVTAVTFWMVRGYIRRVFLWEKLREMLRFALPTMPAALACWILAVSDRIFLLKFSSLSEVGLYAMGSKLTMILIVAATAFGHAWPYFAFSVMDNSAASQEYGKVTTWYFCLGGVIVLMLALFSGEFVGLIAAPAYRGAADVVPVLAFGLLLYGADSVLSTGLAVAKKMIYVVPATGIAACVNLLLNWLWIPVYGMTGAAYATLISYGIMTLLTWCFAYRVFPVRYEWGRLALASAVCAGSVFAAKMTGDLSMAAAVACKSALFAVSGCILIATGFYRPGGHLCVE